MEINLLIEILKEIDPGAHIEIKNGELVIDGHFNVGKLEAALMADMLETVSNYRGDD